MLTTMLMAPAFAGYGDAGVGFPTVRGRQMQVWVAAARVEPSAFQSDYQAGGCSFAQFSASEQSPHEPYRWHAGLADVALEHSIDMRTHNNMIHDSSDGTVWSVRVGGSYPGWTGIAENIARGYTSARDTVMRIWMCSSAGHRGSIMSGTYRHFGGDMDGNYATADFAVGQALENRGLRIGAHEPEVPGQTVTFLADWTGATPTVIEVVHDGVADPLSLTWGTATQGVWSTDLGVDRGACHAYWFRAVSGGTEVRFPQDGSYSYGTCAGADPETGWIDAQLGPVVHTQSSPDWTRGQVITFDVTGGAPGATIAVVAGTSTGNGPCPAAIGGTCVDLTGTLQIAAQGVADANGHATLQATVPQQLPAGLVVHHQAVAGDGAGDWVVGPILSGTVR
ncbi:MAG: CAP domain-containing protein [Myxococcales bacterium]|nr:CAP domain-containing protein [Myxococcales bacterium]